MSASVRRRGAPVTALMLVLSGWVGMRIVLMETPSEAFDASAIAASLPEGRSLGAKAVAVSTAAAGVLQSPLASVEPRIAFTAIHAMPTPQIAMWSQASVTSGARPLRIARTMPRVEPDRVAPTVRMAAEPVLAPPAPYRPAAQAGPAPASRWSMDSWLLVRGGDKAGVGAGFTPASYGASQAGAVLRYRLVPGSAHRPAVYARLAGALDGSRQREASAGLSVRPIAELPVVVAAEARVVDDKFGTRVRPVAMAITEIPPVRFGPDLQAEVYVQGGYAGGKQPTPFIDGQARVDRAVASAGKAQLRVGAGAWVGAQKGASRLDLGPAATVTAPVGDRVFARASLEWRFRVTGDAAPGSGPALTLSAGF